MWSLSLLRLTLWFRRVLFASHLYVQQQEDEREDPQVLKDANCNIKKMMFLHLSALSSLASFFSCLLPSLFFYYYFLPLQTDKPTFFASSVPWVQRVSFSEKREKEKNRQNDEPILWIISIRNASCPTSNITHTYTHACMCILQWLHPAIHKKERERGWEKNILYITSSPSNFLAWKKLRAQRSELRLSLDVCESEIFLSYNNLILNWRVRHTNEKAIQMMMGVQ